MKILSIAVILLLFAGSVYAQNLIGYKADEIKEYIKTNRKDLVPEDNRNEHFKYLKYTDGTSGTTTVYFFLSEDNKCTRIKRMHVHSLKDELMEELNKLYKRKDENTWTDRRDGEKAIIKLINEEWFLTVTIEPESKK